MSKTKRRRRGAKLSGSRAQAVSQPLDLSGPNKGKKAMKYIKMQPEVALINSMTGEPIKEQSGDPSTFTFEQFILSRLCDAKFGRDMEKIFQAIKIRKQLKEADEYMTLEDADHAALVDSVKSPSAETMYNAVVAASFVPFMEAINGATSEKPAKKSNGQSDEKPEAKDGKDDESASAPPAPPLAASEPTPDVAQKES
jgi:hypothetical protein